MSGPNSVNHKQKEFSRRETIFGKEVVVSMNATEGFLADLKRGCALIH